jgi:hypothetical protein
MFRTGLLMYLVLANAVGPGFCAFPQKLAVVFALYRHGDNTTNHHCCPYKDVSGQDRSSNEPTQMPCQCKQPRLVSTTPESSSSDVLKKLTATYDFVAVKLAQPNPDLSTESGRPRDLAFSFLNGRDILRAMQLLLC